MGLVDRISSDTDGPTDIGPSFDRRAEAVASPAAGAVETAFFANPGRVVHKWHHYLPLRMLEIGVSKGGSLKLWRDYFGPDATLFGIDIILDDGSHVAAHQRASFDVLFPLLRKGGIYMVEDLHTAYWREFGGGYESRDSFIAGLKQLVDDMHYWYHHGGERVAAAAGMVAGIHVHDSVVVVEKARVAAPVHSMRGADPISAQSTGS